MTMRPEDIKLLRDAAYWVGRRPADDRYTEVARISRSLDELADRLDAPREPEVKACEACSGSGKKPWGPNEACEDCGGSGEERKAR